MAGYALEACVNNATNAIHSMWCLLSKLGVLTESGRKWLPVPISGMCIRRDHNQPLATMNCLIR